MAATEIPELPEGGVEIEQVFEAAAPVAVIPTLTPCIVGACYEIREVLNDDGTVNSDVIVSGPAIATAPNDETSYTAMSGKTLKVRVNGDLEQTFTMPAIASMTAQQVASAINGADPVGFDAYVYENDSGDKFLELRTASAGEDQTLQITGGNAISYFGYGTGQTFYGLGAYRNGAITLKQTSFPDPRGNLTELNIVEDSIRVFLDLATEVREILRSESFLRRGVEDVGPPVVPGATAVTDGDGDTTTPYVDLKDDGVTINLTPTANSASAIGSVDLTTARYLHNKNLILSVDGAGAQTVKLVGNPVVSEDPAALYPWTGTFTITVNGQTGIVVNVSAASDLNDLVAKVNADTDVVALGLGNIAFASDANGNAGATHLGLLVGGAPASPVDNTEIIVTACSTNDLFLTASCPYQQKIGSSTAGPRDDVATQINALFPSSIATYSTNFIKLDSPTIGQESTLNIDSNSTALTGLGLTAAKTYGGPFQVHIGDYLYAGGEFLGIITEIRPGAVAGRVRLDREVTEGLTWNRWYIVAKNLENQSALWGISYPRPDLRVDTSGNALVKQDFLRDVDGAPATGGIASMYVAYKALRLDVTADADDPELLSFDSTDALEEALGPIVPANPLSYGIFCALGNAAGSTVTGLGVGEVSDDKPNGTLEAFTEAFDFLEMKEVYAIAPMTSDLDVLTVAKVHVDAMSEKARKLERIVVGHLGVPTRKIDDIVVSGTDGDTVSVGVFNTKKASLSAALLALGVDPSSIDVSDGVFIDVASDSGRWNVTGPVVDGTKLTVNTAFAPGENDDGFYATGTFPTVISDTFSVYVRGALITSKDEEVETLYYRGKAFADRRVRIMQLDQLRATVDSIDSLVDGFFACAARAGMLCGLHPSQPLTRYPVAVFTGVTGTNKRYSPKQLNQIAAGGLDIWVQEKAGTPVYSRRQLTTDLTSVETAESSINNAIDYTAKFLRSAYNPFIGRYNITQPFLDTLSTVGEGAKRFLVDEAKVLKGLDILSLEQSTTNPDRAKLKVRARPWYPCNAIEITIYI